MRGIKGRYFYLTLLLVLPLVVQGTVMYYFLYLEIPELSEKNLTYVAVHMAKEIEKDLTDIDINNLEIAELNEINLILTHFPDMMISFIKYPNLEIIAHYSNKNGKLAKDNEIIGGVLTGEVKDIIIKKRYPYFGKLSLADGKAYVYLQPVYVKGELVGFVLTHQNRNYLSVVVGEILRLTGTVLFLMLLVGIGYSLHYVFLNDRRTIALTKSNWDLQRKLNAVLENAQTGIVLVDRDLTITYINPMAEDFFKISFAEAVGKQYDEFIKSYIITDEEKKSSFLVHTLKTGNTVYKKTITFKVLGEMRLGEVCTGIIQNNLGQIDGAFLFIQDITDKRQKEELAAKTLQLAAAGEIMSELTHELKNAFMVLTGLSKLCQDGRPELKMLDEEINRLYRLTTDFLSLTRAYRAKKERFDFQQLVVEVLALVDKEARKQKVKIETFLHYPPYLKGDRNLLKQALLNVLLNAVEAMEGGGVLKVYLDYNVKSQEIVLTVADSGPGIPPEILQKICQPFFTTKERGTGLGLPFTKRVVEYHLGKLMIKSEVGKGTWVIITLPVEENIHEKVQVV
ncbi:sensory box histidine kinase [Carboxydothermus hydrogenoformans Z-2901]|uniref:histidine kinase n=2 Tax=Carboxydothermus hydrogenoformans TaxID=129958 RepID=Q3AFB2_CARHZ|nr:sensory box histidine kinase [Carboxydothermus hydrogenoformans Z-2901]